MNVVVLVPRRSDRGHRDRLWWWVRERLHREHPWRVVEGVDVDGEFSRARALNRAAAEAGRWDVAVVHDADVWVRPEQLVEAVRVALSTGWMVVAHDEYRTLTERSTNEVLVGVTEITHGEVEHTWPEVGLNPFAITRGLWDRVGGFDERFVGRGYQDTAFHWACRATAGGFGKVAGPMFHLWHEKEDGGGEKAENRALGLEYERRYRAGLLTGVLTQ